MTNHGKKVFIAVISAIASPALAYAATFNNPAEGFFVNLGSSNTFPGLILFIINAALGIVGLLSIAFIIYGGFQYITSRGDEEQASAGKKTLTNAIIGLVIILLSYTIVTVIFRALTGK